MKKLIYVAVAAWLSLNSQAQEIKKDAPNRNVEIIQHSGKPSSNSDEKGSICSTTVSGTIGLLDCSDVGTTVYNTVALSDDMSDVASVTTNAPSPAPTCWDGWQARGNWEKYNLEDGVTSLSVDVTSLGTYSSLYVVWMTFYQGASCSSLTQIDCQVVAYKSSSGTYYPVDLIIEGLDPDLPLWIYTSGDYYFDLECDLRGMNSPTNTTCSSSIEESVGCNVGAVGDVSWTGPTADGVMCSGTDCDWRIDMYDSSSDGWDSGGYLEIFVDGTSIGTFTVSSGSSNSESFTVEPDVTVEFVYHPGTFDNENTFVLTDPYGVEAYSSGTMSSISSTVLSFDGYCAHTWYSNENTVYYTFTATDINASIEVDDVICNDGTVGEAQFGVWKSCADVGDYTTNFVGCAVGTGAISMPSLTVGESYVIAVDGQAGDICNWNFITNGIILPTDLIAITAKSYTNYNFVEWATASERNADYFIIERSYNGKDFETVGQVSANGTTSDRSDYTFNDFSAQARDAWYRLKQYDFNGEFKYLGPARLMYSENIALTVSPNPTSGELAVNYVFEKNKTYEITVFDLSGRTVINQTVSDINGSIYTFDVSDFVNGTYVLQVVNDQVKDQVKFIKQ